MNLLINGDFSQWVGSQFVVNPQQGVPFADQWFMLYDGEGGKFSVSKELIGRDDRPFAPKQYLRILKRQAGSGQSFFKLKQLVDFSSQTPTLYLFARSVGETEIKINGLPVFLNERWTCTSLALHYNQDIEIDLPINQAFQIEFADLQFVLSNADRVVWNPMIIDDEPSTVSSWGTPVVYSTLTTYILKDNYLYRGDQVINASQHNPEFVEIMNQVSQGLVDVVNYREIRGLSKLSEAIQIEIFRSLDYLKQSGLSSDAMKALEEALR